MLVSALDLERSLARLQSRTEDPQAGVFGPDSAMWTVSRESALLVLGGGRAALLQLAHPAVAHAIDQHSQTKADIAGRFQRTFANVFAMIFGTLPDAVRSAREVHKIHQRVRGTLPRADGSERPYWANDPDALLWVAATLWETSVDAYERFVGPLSDARKEAYYRDTKTFAALFGIPAEILPGSWAEFMDYCRGMWASETLRVDDTAREIARFILAAPRPLLSPSMAWVRLVTAATLPPRLRSEFALRYGRVDRAAFALSSAAFQRTYRRLPARLRYLPAYQNAGRRLAGRRPTRTSALLERSLVKLITRPG